jgi:hypothetical protein
MSDVAGVHRMAGGMACGPVSIAVLLVLSNNSQARANSRETRRIYYLFLELGIISGWRDLIQKTSRARPDETESTLEGCCEDWGRKLRQ